MTNSTDSKVPSDFLDQLPAKLSTDISTKISNKLILEIETFLRAQEKRRHKENIAMVAGFIGLWMPIFINITNLDIKISKSSTSLNSQIEYIKTIINSSNTVDNSITGGVGVNTDVRINTR